MPAPEKPRDEAMDGPVSAPTTPVSPEFYDQYVANYVAWFTEAAALLRAARAVFRQDRIDRTFREGHCDRLHGRETVTRAGFFLAALSVENALKSALMVVHGPISPAVSGSLPSELKTHDLAALATSIGIATSKDEDDALRFGEELILWWGRYPHPTSAKFAMTRVSIDVARLVETYEGLAVRAIERLALAEHPTRVDLQGKSAEKHASEMRESFLHLSGGISEPWPKEEDCILSEMLRST